MAKKYQKIKRKSDGTSKQNDNTRVAPTAKKRVKGTVNSTTKNSGSFNHFVFTKKNYMLMGITLAIIALGFVLMYGKENIYNFRKTVIAPIVVLLGFVFGVYAILYKDKSAE